MLPHTFVVSSIYSGTTTNRTPNAQSGDDDGEVSSSSYCVRARGDVIYYVQYIQMWSDDDDELEWERKRAAMRKAKRKNDLTSTTIW